LSGAKPLWNDALWQPAMLTASKLVNPPTLAMRFAAHPTTGTMRITDKKLLCRLSPPAETVVLALRREYTRSSVMICPTDDAFRSAVRQLASENIAGVVWEASSALPRWPDHIPTEVTQLSTRIPILVHAQPSSSVMRELVTLATRAADLRVALVGFGDFEDECRTLMAGLPQTSATQPIVATIGPARRRAQTQVLATAAIASKRRISVGRFAAFLECTPGTLRRWVGSNGLEPHHLIGLLTSVHVAWRRAVLDWSLKRTAAETGSAIAALDHYVRRHCRCRLTDMTEPRHFSDLLRIAERVLLSNL